MILCDVTSYREDYKYPELLNDGERLQSAKNLFGVLFALLLVSCLTLSAIVRVITVIIRDFLSACVGDFRKCCLPVLCVFELFENKASFSIILLFGLLSQYTYQTIFVTI
ncbi:hypothetical protein AVEN_210834-1 [Araneus ventricosus]|uniref:Uncharacterized protein n=1 Tax=Araneus ventricosus TaxID=182803 RepID=A0A4Y2WCC4_ARAVE|nr:hypothetical protein AVEN_6772-1 [Araneus ventricosus]GBO34220.1 hypothetical protein AVEN_210834-1 [Araneus ventricosus]